MRNLAVLAAMFLLLAAPGTAFSVNLLNCPESAVYDSLHHRYLVSNVCDGNIIQIDSLGQQSYFNTDLDFTAGLHIVGETLYAASSEGTYAGLIGFDLATGEIVFNLPLPGQQLLNDITSDTSGYLYVTEYYGNLIYRVQISTQMTSVLVDYGLSLPNGILFDAPNNRLLLINEGAAGNPICAVSLPFGMTSTLVNVGLTNMDGLTEDNDGNKYFSSWTTGSIYKYDPDFNGPYELFSSGYVGPADIYYNKALQEIAVPCYGANELVILPDIYSRDSDSDGLVDADDNCPNHPNPGQEDLDTDGAGDLCDNCPDTYNPAQADIDGDGIGDACETLRTWQVWADGMGDAATIQAGIDSCTHGDTVVVGDGLYTGDGNRSLVFGGRRGVLLRSMNGPEFTVIDCEGSSLEPRRGFNLTGDLDSTSVIDGFTIQGGYGPGLSGGSCGGGMLIDHCSPTIKNCILADNNATFGGAVYADGASLRLINCTFVGNNAEYGAAILPYNQTSVTLDKCLIAFNEGGQPVYCLEASSGILSCCDVYGNSGGDWVGCISGQDGLDGNFSGDPRFCDAGEGEYDLLVSSPCAPANNGCGALIGALPVGCSCDCGVGGDMDGDGEYDPIDVTYLVNYVYLMRDALCVRPDCPYPTGDLDCDNEVNPLDAAYLVSAVFKAQNAICAGCGQ